MKNQLVYDLPTRLFHWLFAGLFLTAFVIAKTIDDESPTYSFHMLAGMTLGFTVILRIVWGFVGTKHARFSEFALNPMDLIDYLMGILSGSKKRWAGHNPASSWAAITMMVLALGLGLTGYLMTSGSNKETFEDVHELLANGFIVVVILHVAGIILHTLRHKEMIGLSMVNGKKVDIPLGDEISSARSGIGLVFVGLIVVFATHLWNNFDTQTGNLKVFGYSLQLSEGDESGSEESGGESTEDSDDDNDNDD